MQIRRRHDHAPASAPAHDLPSGIINLLSKTNKCQVLQLHVAGVVALVVVVVVVVVFVGHKSSERSKCTRLRHVASNITSERSRTSTATSRYKGRTHGRLMSAAVVKWAAATVVAAAAT